ncbi:NAD(P)/FAD-dependent oxidoreductase [Rhodanobacter sp. DHG33]|uniref:FAD-dependent oxidoreductase n=1 Tax=Rhodanobacter sp. DHG33 TaxID=2775921 RepID=UPI0017811363|nr:NAD(P)/FAD-dependent oxidoreductase [Rhodanobacter sp. DHG33]MBD8899732.1 FAD-dependent monooxygenase [Rhodanobacter sp. DHG33]
MKIAIVGYGAAGQAASLFLAQQGHRLSVFEQAGAPGPVGAGFLLQPTGLAVLARLGLHEQALAQGQRIESLHGCNTHGRQVMAMRYADHAPDCFGLGLSRGALFSLLRDAYADAGGIHVGTRMVGVDAEAGMLFDEHGGGHGPFDLIVAADGAGSRLRASLPGLAARDVVYPWGAVWCLLPAGDWAHADTLQQRYAGAREMIGLLPVGRRVDRDGRWLTFYFSLPGEQVDAFDAAALRHLRERVAALWPEASPLLDGIDAPEQLHRSRYRDVVMRVPHRGRVVFLGDSAHAMSPQLGQGVNMALLDAQSLADALVAHDNLALALRAHVRTRRRHLQVYQSMSRWLTPLFQSKHDRLAQLRDFAFGPLGRFPLARGQMLRILTGTKQGWWR